MAIDPHDWSPFVADVFHRLLLRLDRDALIKLLSIRCPYCVGQASLEAALAGREIGGNRLLHPITILGEAYVRCRIPEVRRILIWPIRRSFAGHGIAGKDDAEFVRNAMQWYEENKDHLAVNLQYSFAHSSGAVVKWIQEDPEYFERQIAAGKAQSLYMEKSDLERLGGHPREPVHFGSVAPRGAAGPTR